MTPVTFGVLGSVEAWGDDGTRLDLKGPRHRAVLARLIAGAGRVVPVDTLVEDLWEDPSPNAVGAIRTFVGTLRQALEPGRLPRTPSRLLVTEGLGYALRVPADGIDALQFERAVAHAPRMPPDQALAILESAIASWRGPAYSGLTHHEWARAEASRLRETHLTAVERLAGARLALGRAADAVPDLDAHATEHPWREDAWRLLALALYRSNRKGDALAVLRRARGILVDELGLDPSASLRTLESDILRTSGTVTGPSEASSVEALWAATTSAYEGMPGGNRTRLEAAAGLLRTLAVVNATGLETASRQRLATIDAAEQLGDDGLTARVIGSYDVPSIWPRPDDAAQSVRIVAAAERALASIGPTGTDAARARLLATVAIESRGSDRPRGREAAEEAESIARRLGDPALLVFALAAQYAQSFDRLGRAGTRAAIGDEIIQLAAPHDLVTFEIFGHLIGLQATSALGNFTRASEHADALDSLSHRHDRALVPIFTSAYRGMRSSIDGASLEAADDSLTELGHALLGSGMPGVADGIVPLARLSLRVWRGGEGVTDFGRQDDWGPYAAWAHPLLKLARGDHSGARAALAELPDPPGGLLSELLWCLAAHSAVALGDRALMARARDALLPARNEIAGAGSLIAVAGPVAHYLDALDAALTV